MGADKATLSLQGLTLVERAVRIFEAAGYPAKIVGSRPDLEKFAPVIPDLRSGCGPLSGIEAALLHTDSELAVFIPVDVPLLPSAMLRRLVRRALVTGAMMTAPRVLGFAQPLCAVYHWALLPSISSALDRGDHKVMRVMLEATAALGGEVDIFDIETLMTAGEDRREWPLISSIAFLNCNTREDLTRIQHHIL
jgi:molybdopterin-guanine dinucleotide biosynthesis protein A